MGKQKRMKKETKKLLRKMLKESKPMPFEVDGKVIYFNPVKKLLKGEGYKTDAGVAITQDIARKYENFIKAKFERIKENYIKETENGNGNKDTGHESKIELESNSEGNGAV